jgi:zinc and cadmium transporter
MSFQIWFLSILSVFVVSLISLVGIFFLSLNETRLRRILLFLVSFAVGGLFGDAFIHLLPESFEKLGTALSVSLYIIAGVLVFFVVEKFIRWRHCHIPTSEHHPHPVVAMNLIGDGVHNFIDGMVIAASFSVSVPLGLTTTLAVVLHEIPQEIGDFGVLVNGGLKPRRALAYNFLSALAAVLGAVIALLVGPLVKNFSIILLPFTAGGFIYIAGSDLIPELQHSEALSDIILQFGSIILGIAILALLRLVG